jgi:hypothetical protein
LTIDNDKDRKELIKHGVLAFESLKYKQNLEALDKISPENIAEFTEVFVEFDDIEATMYHQIVQERIAVIKALQEKTEANAREKLLQEHLYTHLWLLDPSWERATGTEYMEQQVSKEFHKIDAKLTADEKRGRLDLKYKTTTGKHIIIELKRAERVCSTFELLPQIQKYRTGLQKILDSLAKKEPIEIVIVVGRELSDWTTSSERKTSEEMLKPQNARVVTYQSLIENAYKGYQRFLEKNKDAGKIFRLIKDIEEQDFGASDV